MKSVEEIIKPYENLSQIDYKKIDNGNLNPDTYLFQIWHRKVGLGWYGFSLGKEVPFVWATIIDLFLKEVEKECPDFEIHQIKLKFGGLRIYLGNVNQEVNDKCIELEEVLFNESLIY